MLIVGGGVAGLEAALALRELGGDRIATTMIAPDPEFVYRPMTVREPFGYAEARRYPLEELARDIGVDLRVDSFKWLERERRVVHTETGDQLSYDALLLALGARLYTRFNHALTVDDARLDELLHGLIQDIEGGYVHSLAFILSGRVGWPLPIYELALMTAARAQDMNIELSITIATPEDAPLAIFGHEASKAVRQLLEDNGIVTITSAPARFTSRVASRSIRVGGTLTLIASSRCPSCTAPRCPVYPLIRSAVSSRSTFTARSPVSTASGPRATRPISRSSMAVSPRSRPTSPGRRSPRSRVSPRNPDRSIP